MFKRLLISGLIVFGVLGVGSSPTYAQNDETERTAVARSLFEQGLNFADANQWGDAADRFWRAYTMRPSAAIAYNLGLAFSNLGRLVEASEYFRRVLRDDTAPADLRKAARSRLDKVAPRIGKLALHVTGDMTDVTAIMLNARIIGEQERDVPIPVNPGHHRVRAMRGEIVAALTEADVEEGRLTEVDLEIPPPAPTRLTVAPKPVAKPKPLQTAPEPKRSETIFEKPWFIPVVGAIVVGAVITTVLVLK